MDRFSNLPDPILSEIVSFLPTKEAIRTSILSRQWRYVCSSLSKLDFYQFRDTNNDSKHYESFKSFVDKMFIRSDKTDIEKLSLHVLIDDQHIRTLDINNWISIAVEHNVQHLCLWAVIFSGKPEKLPCCFFTCTTLRHLELYCIHLNLPTIIRFPMLKYLMLNSVQFHDDNDAVKKFISCRSCPVLRDLVILYCDQINSVSFLSYSLKYLKLYTSNVVPCVKLSIPYLQEIDYRGIPPDITCTTLGHLRNATFEFALQCLANPNDKAWTTLSRLFQVETLSLNSFFIESLSRDRCLAYEYIINLCLKDLHLCIYPTKNQVQVIRFLMWNFHFLETLHIYIEEYPKDTLIKEDCNQFEKKILNRYLRRVDIKHFRGTDNELDLVRHLFDSSTILEEMNISYLKQIGAYNRTRINKKLLSFARLSSHVTLRF